MRSQAEFRSLGFPWETLPLPLPPATPLLSPNARRIMETGPGTVENIKNRIAARLREDCEHSRIESVDDRAASIGD